MAVLSLPDLAVLREMFTYDPDSGDLIWKERPPGHFRNQHACNAWNARFAGKTAGGVSGTGYRNVGINGTLYLVHRIIWKLHHGTGPGPILDHINRDKQDNRVENLREISKAENCQNTVDPRSNNASGFMGVSRHGDRWRATIWANGERKNLGCFDAPEQAQAAYLQAKALLHPAAGLAPAG